jgi:hypothetical protein
LSLSTLIWSQAAAILVVYFGVRLEGLPRSEITRPAQALRWYPVLGLVLGGEAVLLLCAWLFLTWALIPGFIVALLVGMLLMEEVRVRISRRQRLSGQLPPGAFREVVPRGKVRVQVKRMPRGPVLYVYKPGEMYSTRASDNLIVDQWVDWGAAVLVQARKSVSTEKVRTWRVENNGGKPKIKRA